MMLIDALRGDFEEKWLNKVVRPTGHYNIPDKNYLVTAALYHWEDNITKFAIFSDGFITFDLEDDEVELLDERFEFVV